VSTDIERRITGALAARAELTDGASPPGLAAHPALTRSRSASRRWRAPVAVAAGLVAVTVLAASLAGGRTSVEQAAPPPAVTSGPAPSATSSDPGTTTPVVTGLLPGGVPGPTSPSDLLTVPASPTVGVAYPFDLLTHCGVVGVFIGGVYFAAEQPLTDGPTRQAGWANPFQRGTMTLLNTTEAQFTDNAGHTARFHVDLNTSPPVPCD
jgi:hypothetical protein